MSKFLLTTSLFLLFSFLFSHFTYAQNAWIGRCVGGATGDVATIQGLECLFYNVLQVIAVLAGLAFLIMFIIGGFQYMTSNDDQKQVTQAANTLTMSFIGLVGIIISWLILRLIQNFTGVNVVDFIIPG